MVLPSSSPLDPHASPAEEWVEQIDTALRLTRRGILVLVDEAQPWRLRDLLRVLLPTHPEIEVHVDPRAIETVGIGSTLVLVPRSVDADGLNMARPIFSRRELKVVLFCDRSTSEALAYRAPDFFDWISIYTECPPTAPTHVVRGIRSAMESGASGIVWLESRSGDVDAMRRAFEEAAPIRKVVEVDPTAAFGEMVQAIRSAGHGFAWVRTTHWKLLRRFRWALAEAGMETKGIVVMPRATAGALRIPDILGDFVPVGDATYSIRDAYEMLAAAGATRAGRLAALTGFEDDAVHCCEALLRHGDDESSLWEALKEVEDPGVWLARRAMALELREPSVPIDGTPSPLAFRALGESLLAERRRLVETEPILQRGREEPQGSCAIHAFRAGDYNAGIYWASRAIEEDRDDAVTAIEVRRLLGEALFEQGARGEAIQWLRESMDRAERARRADLVWPVVGSLAHGLARLGRTNGAARLVDWALSSFGSSGASDWGGSLIPAIAEILRRQFRLAAAEVLLRKLLSEDVSVASISQDGAELAAAAELKAMLPRSISLLDHWWGTASVFEGERWPALAGLGEVSLAEGRYEHANRVLERALAEAEAAIGPEHPRLCPILEDLAEGATAQERLERARTLEERALTIRGSSFSPGQSKWAHLQRDSRIRATEVLLNLPVRERRIVGMRYLDAMPYAAIAAEMRISETAVRRILVRAVMKLNKSLDESSR